MNNRTFAEALKNGEWKNQLVKGLSPDTKALIDSMTLDELTGLLNGILKVPISFDHPPIDYEMYYLHGVYASIDTFAKFGLPDTLRVLEIASGDQSCVPHAIDIYSHGSGQYVTANLNKELTENFKKNTSHLKIDLQIIEDNACNLLKYFENKEQFDIISFQHAVNDIIQTIIAEKEGIDTVNNCWWDILKPMIGSVTDYYLKGQLKAAACDDFIALIEVCSKLLKKGGYMTFNNCIFQVDMDCGYPMDLYGSFIKIAEDWINTSGLGLKAVTLDGYDPKWWLFMHKI